MRKDVFTVKPTHEMIHAFIVRIWVEPQEAQGAEPIWRGAIEHVHIEDTKNKKTVYFDHVDKLSSYFAEYLHELGINIHDF